MNKILSVFISITLSLFSTCVIAQSFSIYSFGTLPTARTLLYLLLIFCATLYLLLFAFYVVKKLKNKEKIGFRKILSALFFFWSLLLFFNFFIALQADFLNRHIYSAPFHFYILMNCAFNLLPCLILSGIGAVLIKKPVNKNSRGDENV